MNADFVQLKKGIIASTSIDGLYEKYKEIKDELIKLETSYGPYNELNKTNDEMKQLEIQLNDFKKSKPTFAQLLITFRIHNDDAAFIEYTEKQERYDELNLKKDALEKYIEDYIKKLPDYVDVVRLTSLIKESKMKLYELNVKLMNVINVGEHSCMIFLKDNSRFIVNFDTITYLNETQYIDNDLYNRMIDVEEETSANCIKSTGNQLIPSFFIIESGQLNIIIKDACSTNDVPIKLDKYLLTENIFKMLLIEYNCINAGVQYSNISLVYNLGIPSNLSINYHLNYLDRTNSDSLNYMFVVKTISQGNHHTFGWILETNRHDKHDEYEKKVLIFFKIIDGVLYTLNTSTLNKYKYSINDTSFSIIRQEPTKDTETGKTTYVNVQVITIIDGKIQLYNIPDFNNKTLQNEHILASSSFSDEHTIGKIQIYEINGRVDHKKCCIDATPKLFKSVNEFKITEETIKDILHKVTHTDETTTEFKFDCSVPVHCPIHNPYFCPEGSAFRTNVEKKQPSKGNNSPCVPDMALCALSYEDAKLKLDKQYYENKKIQPRNYFSKAKYCKTDEYLDNKQMSSGGGGGSVHFNKKRTRRYSKKKTTKGFKSKNRSKKIQR